MIPAVSAITSFYGRTQRTVEVAKSMLRQICVGFEIVLFDGMSVELATLLKDSATSDMRVRKAQQTARAGF